MNTQKLTPQQAFPKIKQFCAYQERCHSEVQEKLYGYGLTGIEVGEIISRLIEENYLNEERYAIQFAGGKFRVKQWGRVKIKYELKQRNVSEYCIRKGLASIDNEAYFTTLEKLKEQKLQTLRGERNVFIKKRKLQDYLLSKGFEGSVIRESLDEI
ncbi:MAG: regulatory protein RecX [Ferruginibacter sp.]